MTKKKSETEKIPAAERRELEERLTSGKGIPSGYSYAPHSREVFFKGEPPESAGPAAAPPAIISAPVDSPGDPASADSATA